MVKIIVPGQEDVTLDDSQNQESVFSPVCSRCIHLDVPSIFRGKPQCKAFRQKTIPKDIWNGIHDHKTPFKGDNGIMFTPKSNST